jgi:hypothetical protein
MPWTDTLQTLCGTADAEAPLVVLVPGDLGCDEARADFVHALRSGLDQARAAGVLPAVEQAIDLLLNALEDDLFADCIVVARAAGERPFVCGLPHDGVGRARVFVGSRLPRFLTRPEVLAALAA